MTSPIKRETFGGWCWYALLFSVVGYAANVWWGTLNQDEGWYLYAARAVMDGLLPHRDFFFTQGLGLPVVYGALGALWSPLGVLGGRILTAVLALAALLIASRVVWTVTPRRSAFLVLWALLGLNLWYSYFTTIPKAYALCTVGIAAALWCLNRQRAWAYCCAGVLLAALVNVRVSMGVLLPIVGLWLLVIQRQRSWVWFGLGAGFTLLGTVGVELLLWRDAFWEAQTFHAARASLGLFGKLGCLARLFRFNSLLVVCLVALAIVRPNLREKPHVLLWMGMSVGLLLVHLAAPVPYDDYMIPALLPLVMAVAVCVEDLRWAKGLLCGACLLTMAGSPTAQTWVVQGQDRFWPILKSESDLATLRAAGRVVAETAQTLGTDTLWTQDTYVAVEAGLRVPRGLEMGPFSKPCPMDPTCTPLAAISGYTFAMNFPALTPNERQREAIAALIACYPTQVAVFPTFGQAQSGLMILKRAEE